MQTDMLIDQLVAGLEPVRPRSRWREAALLGLLVLLEIPLFLLLSDLRPDMPQAMVAPAFWWKSGSFAIVAILAGAAMLISLDPSTSTPRRLAGWWRALAGFAPLALALGWLIDAGASGRSTLLARLEWRDGLDCLANIALLTLPLVLALGLLMQRGAPTQPGRTSAAAGLAAAAAGAVVFALHCPHDDPLYVAVWYGGAVLGVAGIARAVLPRVVRW